MNKGVLRRKTRDFTSEENKGDSLAAGLLAGAIGFSIGGPAGAFLGFILGAGLTEANRDKQKNFRRELL